MSLLVDTTAAALDPSYADVAALRRQREAAARAAGQPPAPRRRGLALLVLVLVLLGTVTGIGAAQARARAHQVSGVRTSLLDEVQRRTRESDALATQATQLRTQVQTLQDDALGEGERGRAAAAQVRALELATGGLAVHGPGLVVTLDDAPDSADGAGSADRGGQVGDGRIYDRDLQDVVNALWAAGAEAIAVNGQRLTAQTAIRSAGEAVLVDFRPLSPPYTMRAVGDVDAMEPAFADSPTARRFTTWTSLYGLRFEFARDDDLRLPAAGTPDLRHAKGVS